MSPNKKCFLTQKPIFFIFHYFTTISLYVLHAVVLLHEQIKHVTGHQRQETSCYDAKKTFVMQRKRHQQLSFLLHKSPYVMSHILSYLDTGTDVVREVPAHQQAIFNLVVKYVNHN
ncbi:hypothetical protein AMECASPLE_013075 [Ameca splendens]|uniref:Uncharacterized protein n=1 Tax=Ameca splendens TaxID=208324 RepID=A0ABV1A800_9TELE